jgi:hypothetical protein
MMPPTRRRSLGDNPFPSETWKGNITKWPVVGGRWPEGANLRGSILGGRSPLYSLSQSLVCINILLSKIADPLASLQENSFQILASGGAARGCGARFLGDAR